MLILGGILTEEEGEALLFGLCPWRCGDLDHSLLGGILTEEEGEGLLFGLCPWRCGDLQMHPLIGLLPRLEEVDVVPQ